MLLVVHRLSPMRAQRCAAECLDHPEKHGDRRLKAEYTAENAVAGLQAAYDRDENDEFVKATTLVPAVATPAIINNGDALIFMNFRADRAREITRAFVDGISVRDSPVYSASRPPLKKKVTWAYFSVSAIRSWVLPKLAMYSPNVFFRIFGGKAQGVSMLSAYWVSTLYTGESRTLIPSPDVATYDLQPEMSAPELTDKLVDAINSGDYDLIICNYANGDMVGHTGVFDAAVKAVECVDSCIGRVVEALKHRGGQCLITADHGNVEQMTDPATGQAHTAHTCEKIPLIYFGPNKLTLAEGGVLSRRYGRPYRRWRSCI
jgi:2,3-bisphosphoglycerate-independent phosphoglycerate mutase